MPYFDRFDICEAYLLLEYDYNMSGWLQERPSNQRRRESTEVQLVRMGFQPGAMYDSTSMGENAREIYTNLQRRYGFDVSHSNRVHCDNAAEKEERVECDDEVTCIDCVYYLREPGRP